MKPSSAGRVRRRDLLDDLNRLLESEGVSVVPILRKATRLAQLSEEHEYKILFQWHLDGVPVKDLKQGKQVFDARVQTWPDKSQMERVDTYAMLLEDRAVGDGKIDSRPAHEIEALVVLFQEERDRQFKLGSPQAVGLTKSALPLRAVIERMRNRVGVLARVVEASLLAEADEFGPPSLRSIADGGKIFIGHGHSDVWKSLRDFLWERLRLPCEDFNHQTPAGKSNKEVLQRLLEHACFAFLVMTGDDVHPDGQHARENVIHEVGLFQGTLGFERAIVLLEEGCREFSNIHGLGQIRFPKGDIAPKWEEIREALEREGITST